MTMKYVITTPTGKELILDETHICTKNSPLQCMSLPKEIIDDYLQIIMYREYTIKGVE